LRGLGVEPVLDCVAEYCKWPLFDVVTFALSCVFMHADRLISLTHLSISHL